MQYGACCEIRRARQDTILRILVTIHTFSEYSKCFWSCWKALEEAKDGKCNMELIVRSRELDKTRFWEALLEYELRGFRYIKWIRLKGSFANPCITTDCLVDRLPLGGRRRGFSPNSSVSSSITHRHIIYVCILLPYSFTFHFTVVIIWICVRVACLFIRLHLHYFAFRIKLV